MICQRVVAADISWPMNSDHFKGQTNCRRLGQCIQQGWVGPEWGPWQWIHEKNCFKLLYTASVSQYHMFIMRVYVDGDSLDWFAGIPIRNHSLHSPNSQVSCRKKLSDVMRERVRPNLLPTCLCEPESRNSVSNRANRAVSSEKNMNQFCEANTETRFDLAICVFDNATII